jgi:hypothetical protein
MMQRIVEAAPAEDVRSLIIVLLGALAIIVCIVLALQSGQTELDRKKYIIEVATFLTLFGYAGITVFLWLTQRETNRINQEIFLDTNRPWISVDGTVDDPLHIDNTGVIVRIDWRLKNHGHRPAQEVEVWPVAYPFAAMYSSQRLFKNPNDEQEFWCRMHTSIPPQHGRGMGFVIFPDEERTAGVSTTIERKSYVDETAESNKKEPPSIQIVVVGCATYTFDGSDRRHQTGFLYLLSKIHPTDAWSHLGIPVTEGVVPASQLRLTTEFGGRGVTD